MLYHPAQNLEENVILGHLLPIHRLTWASSFSFYLEEHFTRWHPRSHRRGLPPTFDMVAEKAGICARVGFHICPREVLVADQQGLDGSRQDGRVTKPRGVTIEARGSRLGYTVCLFTTPGGKESRVWQTQRQTEAAVYIHLQKPATNLSPSTALSLNLTMLWDA